MTWKFHRLISNKISVNIRRLTVGREITKMNKKDDLGKILSLWCKSLPLQSTVAPT